MNGLATFYIIESVHYSLAATVGDCHSFGPKISFW